jgi:hypothetical protein
MSLRELTNAGVASLLEAAADVVAFRGIAKGVRYNPSDGSIDLVAALALASGAKAKSLLSSVSLLDTGTPPAMEANLHAALDVLDALVPEVEAWADSPDITSQDVESLLRDAAMRLRIAVI